MDFYLFISFYRPTLVQVFIKNKVFARLADNWMNEVSIICAQSLRHKTVKH